MKRGLRWTDVIIVAVIVAVAAAIAIPLLNEGRQNVWNARGRVNMLAYAMAQAYYIKTDWDGNGVKEYAHPFTNLYMDATCGNKVHKLIDKEFGEASVPAKPKEGYYFGDLATIVGVPITWTADYGLCGAPAAYGRTGTELYVVGSGGRPFGTDAVNVQAVVKKGEAVKLLTDYPDLSAIRPPYPEE